MPADRTFASSILVQGKALGPCAWAPPFCAPAGDANAQISIAKSAMAGENRSFMRVCSSGEINLLYMNLNALPSQRRPTELFGIVSTLVLVFLAGCGKEQ